MAWSVPVNVLKDLMGHADIETPMICYVGTTEDDAARVRAALASASGGETCAQVARGTAGEGSGGMADDLKRASGYHEVAQSA